jgi:hypothetical protein
VPIPRKELANHMSNICGKRPTTCEECGLSEELWVDEMPRHLRDDCPMRLVECRFGCKEVMRYAYLVKHEKELCDRRLEPCENCGMLMKQKEIADHKVLDCPGFLRYCPAGCGAKVRTIDLKQHQRDECGMVSLYIYIYISNQHTHTHTHVHFSNNTKCVKCFDCLKKILLSEYVCITYL